MIQACRVNDNHRSAATFTKIQNFLADPPFNLSEWTLDTIDPNLEFGVVDKSSGKNSQDFIGIG